MPCALPDLLLSLRALWLRPIACLLLLVCVLLLVVLNLLLLLCVLLVALNLLLLLGVLLLVALDLLLRLLMLLLLCVLRLALLLRVLRFGSALLVSARLLLGVPLFAALRLMLRKNGRRYSECQCEDDRGGDSDCFHIWLISVGCPVQAPLGRGFQNELAQASSLGIDGVADSFTGHEQFDSPVLLPS